MSFRPLKSYHFRVTANAPVYLTEVKRDESGQVVPVKVSQSKVLPKTYTTKLGVQLESGVPLKQVSTVMMRDVSTLIPALDDALHRDLEYQQKQQEQQQQIEEGEK